MLLIEGFGSQDFFELDREICCVMDTNRMYMTEQHSSQAKHALCNLRADPAEIRFLWHVREGGMNTSRIPQAYESRRTSAAV